MLCLGFSYFFIFIFIRSALEKYLLFPRVEIRNNKKNLEVINERGKYLFIARMR